jgi:hypothetical protein
MRVILCHEPKASDVFIRASKAIEYYYYEEKLMVEPDPVPRRSVQERHVFLNIHFFLKTEENCGRLQGISLRRGSESEGFQMRQ